MPRGEWMAYRTDSVGKVCVNRRYNSSFWYRSSINGQPANRRRDLPVTLQQTMIAVGAEVTNNEIGGRWVDERRDRRTTTSETARSGEDEIQSPCRHGHDKVELNQEEDDTRLSRIGLSL
jgi:hypothetical protein